MEDIEIPKIEYTEQERKAKKVFQNYFTSILYEKPSIIVSEKDEVKKNNVSERINSILKNSSMRIWGEIINAFYSQYKDDNNTSKDCVKKGWDEHCRFYLKGGKSTMEFIKSIIYTENEGGAVSLGFMPSTNHKSNIAKAFYQELSYNTDDSDYDFCFVVNPSLLNTERNENFIPFNRKLHKIIKAEKNILEEEIKGIFSDLLERINSSYNQKTKLKTLVKESYDYFTSSEKAVFDEFLSNTLNEPYFNFIGGKSYIDYVEKKVVIPTDTFFLHRLIIPFNFENEIMTFPTIDNKLFAECIDVSFSGIKEVTEKLWKHTELNNILRPLIHLDDISNFSYPVAGLHYQLNDIVVILSEQNPNKPQKRCKRLIEQLYFSCMEENLPSLPSTIHIGKTVYNLMKEEGDCNILNDIMTFKKQIKIKDEIVYVFEVNESIKNIENFELWCRKSKYSGISLSWESQCNVDFISKEELRRRIINICKDDFNVSLIETFKDFEKSYVCILYKNLILISVILSILEGHRNIHMEKAFKNNWEIKDKLDYKDEIELIESYTIKEPLKSYISRIIQKYVNRPYFGVYHTGQRIETLIGYIKRNFLSDKKDKFNLFLEIIYKFNIK
jgi:hypothetical protein